MEKKYKTEKKYSKKDAKKSKEPNMFESEQFKSLPKDAQKKLKNIKVKLDEFSKKVVEKFDKYIVGVALLPPEEQLKKQLGPMPETEADKQKKEQNNSNDADKNDEKINVLVLVDDTDSKKMTKQDLKSKIFAIIEEMAKNIDKDLAPETILLSELWQSCFDCRYEILQMVAISAPVYDTGMLQAIKIAEVHKSMVLKKFEKYIVSYVLMGSIVRGKATPTSDIDVWVIIDDTDVKKMTRIELKDKLRAIIMEMAFEAGDITGIKNKLSAQVHILTDVWDSLKDANPVVFTFLRDGIPFFDRGIFMPWKQLLKMGKIKPSPEAIDLFMSSGDQILERVHHKITDIGIEDIFWAILTPSQAALMLYGIPPPTPNETPEIMKEVFVKKEKLMTLTDVKPLEEALRVRKSVEHRKLKNVSGKEVDKLLKDAETYLKKIKTLFDKISKKKEQEDILSVYETVVTVARDLLKSEGIQNIDDSEIIINFKKNLVNSGKLSERSIRLLKDIFKAKKDFVDKKLSSSEVEKAKKDSKELIKMMIEQMQRKRAIELERLRLRVKYGEKKEGEVMLIGKTAFIIKDIKAETREISKAELNSKGGFGKVNPSSEEEIDSLLMESEKLPIAKISKKLMEDIEKFFGEKAEILVNY